MNKLDIGTALYEKEDFLRLLGEDIARAKEEGRCYSVLAVVAQHLPGENVRDIVEVAAGCLQDLMRDNDLVGRLDDDVLALGLRDTDSVEAGVVSFRLQGDLRLKSFHLRNTVWEPGVASLGENGETTKDLLNAAIEAAKNRRRRLG